MSGHSDPHAHHAHEPAASSEREHHDHAHSDDHDHECDLDDGHDHGHAHHPSHGHHHHHTGSQWLPFALALTLAFCVVEAVAGWWAGSLALLGDAGHMLTDSLALALATLAAQVSRTPSSATHSYGLQRVEALAALTNGVLMLILVVFLSWHAVERLLTPRPVGGETVTLVAALGLALNLAVAWMLSRGEGDLNTRGALLHVMGDLLGSVAALAAGLVIQFTGWTPIDPLLSMLIGGLILASTLSLLRSVVRTLLEGVPDDLSLPEVGHAMASVTGVKSVHDLHIWSLDSKHPALSAHVVVARSEDWPRALLALRLLLAQRFHIEHSTIQPELPPAEGVVVLPARTSLPRAPDQAARG